MEFKDFLQAKLRVKAIIGSTFTIIKLAGSSSTEVFRVNDRIFKVGSVSEAQRELANYGKFQSVLKSYREVFPRVELVYQDSDLAIWEIEDVGQKDMETTVLEFNGSKQQLETLVKINLEILHKIRLIFLESMINGKTGQLKSSDFFEELLGALKVNILRAGLDNQSNQLLLEKIQTKAKIFTRNSILSLAHKDLTVGNIIIADNDQSVKFIDPRQALPYLEESAAIGNVVFDLAGYYTSIWRKQLELQRKNEAISLEMLKYTITREIAKYEQDRIFSHALLELSLLYWLSVYLSCKCDYCTSPERLWLYQAMGAEFDLRSKKFLDGLK